MIEVLWKSGNTWFVREDGRTRPASVEEVCRRFGGGFAIAAIDARTWLEFDNDPRAEVVAEIPVVQPALQMPEWTPAA